MDVVVDALELTDVLVLPVGLGHDVPLGAGEVDDVGGLVVGVPVAVVVADPDPESVGEPGSVTGPDGVGHVGDGLRAAVLDEAGERGCGLFGCFGAPSGGPGFTGGTVAWPGADGWVGTIGTVRPGTPRA